MTQQERLIYLVKGLVEEYTEKYKDEYIEIPNDEAEQFTLFRSLCNIRPAGSMPAEWMKVQDEYLNELAARIAIDTVRTYLKETNSKIQVVFNVFKDIDYDIYNKLLG